MDPQTIEREAEGTYLYTLLKQLDKPYQEVLLMRFMNEMAPKEIATATGESSNAVSVRLHRGIKQLRKLYEKQEGAIHLLSR